jgi:hypothetical protein
MRSTAARYDLLKGLAVDSTVVTSTDYACNKATAWCTASSATSSTSFSCYDAIAAMNTHAFSSAYLDPTMVRGRELMT